MSDKAAEAPPFPLRRSIFRTLYGRLAAVIFGLFLLVGLLYTCLLYTSDAADE